jgi:hypothetical protein
MPRELFLTELVSCNRLYKRQVPREAICLISFKTVFFCKIVLKIKLLSKIPLILSIDNFVCFLLECDIDNFDVDNPILIIIDRLIIPSLDQFNVIVFGPSQLHLISRWRRL